MFRSRNNDVIGLGGGVGGGEGGGRTTAFGTLYDDDDDFHYSTSVIKVIMIYL